MHRGFNHVGLATRDMDATLAFYCNVLGYKIVRYDRNLITEGGSMRHVFLDCGSSQLLSFLAPEGVESVGPWATGINEGLSVPRSFYHFAFHADSEEELEAVRTALTNNKISVSPVIDHDWCRSVYFDDPVNGLSLEYCRYTREFNEDDRTLSTRMTAPIGTFHMDLAAMAESEADRFATLAKRGIDNSHAKH
jgi:catechol 2,3-dioxygenase-like lactoylglutathione lyase family enzyme